MQDSNSQQIDGLNSAARIEKTSCQVLKSKKTGLFCLSEYTCGKSFAALSGKKSTQVDTLVDFYVDLLKMYVL